MAFMAVSLEKEEKSGDVAAEVPVTCYNDLKRKLYTCSVELQNIASHAHRLSHCTWVKQSTGNSANMPQESKLAL